MIKLCCLNRQQLLSFFVQCSHTLLRSINTMLFIKLTDVKKTAHEMSKYTHFLRRTYLKAFTISFVLPKYISFRVFLILFSISLKKKKKKNNKICNAEYTSITANNPWGKILFKLDNTSTCLPMLAIWGLASLTALSAST